MKILANNIEGSVKVKQALQGMQALNKVLECGNKYRFFFKKVTTDTDNITIPAATLPIRSLDDRLQCGSMFALGDDFEQDPLTSKIIDTTGVSPYARIAFILHRAECEAEKAKIEREKKAEAEEMDIDIKSEAFIKDIAIAVNKCELKYFGDRETNTYATIKPLIGGVKTGTFVELVVVPLTQDSRIVKDRIAHVTWDVSSSTKLTKITEACKAKSDDKEFLEVHVNYGEGTNDKQEAGRNLTFNVVTGEDKLCRTEPEVFTERILPMLKQLPADAEVLAVRSAAAVYTKKAAELIESFKKYVGSKSYVFRRLDFDNADVKSTAKDLLDTGIVDKDEVVKNKLIDIVNAERQSNTIETSTESTDDTVDFDVKKASEAKTVDELMKVVEETSSTGDIGALDTSDIDNI